MSIMRNQKKCISGVSKDFLNITTKLLSVSKFVKSITHRVLFPVQK